MNPTGAQRVLVVDDDENIRRMLQDSLALEGFEVITARDGAECLIKAQTERPALILLDIHMPNMDGWEACRRLKTDARTANIPVIFISADGQGGEKKKALALNALAFIAKPVEPTDLVELMKQSMQKPGA